MIVAGVMSGTSADGIDVALVRISGEATAPKIQLLEHEHYHYPIALRKAILAAMNAQSARVADLARLNFFLGDLYSDAVAKLCALRRVRAELVGCHGQTLYHQGEPSSFLGRKVTTTWQTGEGAWMAARLKVPVVSDFRPADMAAGGKGAPLVPLLDVAFYGHQEKLRVLQNLGGIGNLTIIPPGSSLNDLGKVVAFDTGPGNMVIDGCCQNLFGKLYDKNGGIAAKGKILPKALDRALKHPFFSLRPPKTAGREEFGREFVASFLQWCGPRASKFDVMATATALTAASIGNALHVALARSGFRSLSAEYIASGGGVMNRTLMRMIAEQVQPLGFRVLTSDDLGMPSQAKEAVAFALLAYRTWNRQPGNVPRATGASRPVVLGKISYP